MYENKLIWEAYTTPTKNKETMPDDWWVKVHLLDLTDIKGNHYNVDEVVKVLQTADEIVSKNGMTAHYMADIAKLSKQAAGEFSYNPDTGPEFGNEDKINAKIIQIIDDAKRKIKAWS